MKISQKKARFLKSVIQGWAAEKIITQEESKKLIESYEVINFDWKRLAKYSFWISLICVAIAVGSILADEALMAFIARIFHAHDFLKCIFLAVVAAAFYYLGVRRKGKSPEKIFSNEAICFLGVLATAGSITFLGRALDTGSGHFSILLLVASIIYASLGIWFPSKLIWIFALLALGSWLGAETGYISGWGAYYLGMNYPIRFAIFGGALTVCSTLWKHWRKREEFLRPTRVMGLLYLFLALWIMSIFGNYGDIDKWSNVKQTDLIPWAVLFGLVSLGTIFHGIKFDDVMTRGFGLTFLFINLYTRFFEYFWNSLHKAIFFAVLAVSFWFLGTSAEKIWNMSILKAQKAAENGNK